MHFASAFNRIFANDTVSALSMGRQFEHGAAKNVFENTAQATRAGIAFNRLTGDSSQGLASEFQFNLVVREQFMILLDRKSVV